MIRRLTKPEYLCYLALAASSRAEDKHTRVGGVVVNKDWRVLSTAFNGVKSGQEVPKSWELEENRNEKGELIIHCENNLFNFIHDKPYAIGLTISPCFACSKMIVSHGIQEVYYISEYERDIEKKFKKVFDFYSVKYTQLTKENIRNILDFMAEDSNKLTRFL